MTCSHQDSQEERSDWCKEGNLLWMTAEHFLSQLDEPVHAARSLKDSGACDSRHDDIYDICRRSARFQTMVENEESQSKTSDGTQRQAAVTRTQIEREQYNE